MRIPNAAMAAIHSRCSHQVALARSAGTDAPMAIA